MTDEFVFIHATSVVRNRVLEESVSKRQGFSKKQKATMMLSLETITGLRMTGDIIEFTIIVLHYYYYFISAHSFLGLVQHVF